MAVLKEINHASVDKRRHSSLTDVASDRDSGRVIMPIASVRISLQNKKRQSKHLLNETIKKFACYVIKVNVRQ
jgi:hypothetical protein